MAMKAVNVQMIAIGDASPIDEELLSMNKGYLAEVMVAWSNTFHDYGFFIHAMMIFGYPLSPEHRTTLSISDRMHRFRKFIRETKIDTAQILLDIPFAGTVLRSRLERENQIFPFSRIGWEYCDGQFPLFEPDDGSTPEENMKVITAIMGHFYNARNLAKLVVSIVFHFPRMFILLTLSLVTCRVKYLIVVFHRWRHIYFRNYLIRFRGSFIVRRWKKNLKQDGFLAILRAIRHGPHSVQRPK